MFKPGKSFSHHNPSSHSNPHKKPNESPREYAGHGLYGHDFHGHKEYSYKHGRPEQDFHEDEACQRCPYKRRFEEHFHREYNGGEHHKRGRKHHHSHSGQSPEAMRFEDGSLQCLGCPNECVMRVTEDGKVEGNYCPKGAEAVRNIKE